MRCVNDSSYVYIVSGSCVDKLKKDSGGDARRQELRQTHEKTSRANQGPNVKLLSRGCSHFEMMPAQITV